MALDLKSLPGWTTRPSQAWNSAEQGSYMGPLDSEPLSVAQAIQAYYAQNPVAANPGDWRGEGAQSSGDLTTQALQRAMADAGYYDPKADIQPGISRGSFDAMRKTPLNTTADGKWTGYAGNPADPNALSRLLPTGQGFMDTMAPMLIASLFAGGIGAAGLAGGAGVGAESANLFSDAIGGFTGGGVAPDIVAAGGGAATGAAAGGATGPATIDGATGQVIPDVAPAGGGAYPNQFSGGADLGLGGGGAGLDAMGQSIMTPVGAPNGMQSLINQLTQMGTPPQQIQQIIQQMAPAASNSNNSTSTGGFNLGSLTPLLGIGSGLNTMFNPPAPAVDPARLNSLWQAGQDTYNTSLDPQSALKDATQHQVVDATRGADSARGITMGGVSSGLESDAVRKFLMDWQNQQLGRQATGVQAFSQAGNVAANAGVANNAQAFMQNQTGLNNLTSGLGNLFGTGTQVGAPVGSGQTNQIGSWLNSLTSGGGTPAATGGASPGMYNPYPTLPDYSQTQGAFSTGMGP